MYPKKLSTVENPEIRSRMRIERRIVRSLVNELLAQGFGLRVDDGETIHPMCYQSQVVLSHMIETDADQLRVYKTDGTLIGAVYLVYGNDGYDVISDYSLAVEPFMPETLALVEKLS